MRRCSNTERLLDNVRALGHRSIDEKKKKKLTTQAMNKTEPQAGGFTSRLIKWPLSVVLTSRPSGLGNASNFAPLLPRTAIFLARKNKHVTF